MLARRNYWLQSPTIRNQKTPKIKNVTSDDDGKDRKVPINYFDDMIAGEKGRENAGRQNECGCEKGTYNYEMSECTRDAKFERGVIKFEGKRFRERKGPVLLL